MLRLLKLGSKGRRLAWPAVIALVATITVWRCYELLVNPDLRAEDGAKVFAYFYEHREVSALFRFKAGYIPLLPNILGWLSVRLPMRATPYFLTIAPTLLTIAAASTFGASAYRRYVVSDSLRYAVCLALTIAPVGVILTTSNTDYSIWNALLLLMLLVLLPSPHAKLWALLLGFAILVLIWTHPLSIAALPASLVWLWRDKRLFGRIWQAALVVAQVAHVLFGTEPHQATFAKGNGVLPRLGVFVSRVLNHLCKDVISPSLFPWSAGKPSFDFAFAGLFLAALLLCALLKTRVAARSFCLWVGYAIVVPMALIVFARERGLTSSRYDYVPKSFTTIGACLILSQLIFSATRWWPKLARAGLLPAFGVLAYFSYLTVATDRFRRFEQPAPENGPIVAKFFADLAEAERLHGGYCNIRMRCEKKYRDWAFTIDTRKLCRETR